MNRVLIKTAGRTGSHVIAWQEVERLGIDYLHHNDVDGTPDQLYTLQGPCVVHDHTKYVPSDSSEWDLIVSLRRDVYAQAASWCIANATNNFGHAPAADGEFILDPERFIISLKNFKVVNYYWHLLAKFYNWHSVRVVYWEDLLPLDRTYPRNHPGASHDRVVNHTVLRELTQKYIDNHNWAIAQAIDMAQQYIGRIDRGQARRILVDQDQREAPAVSPNP
jgi:hypothetical protein